MCKNCNGDPMDSLQRVMRELGLSEPTEAEIKEKREREEKMIRSNIQNFLNVAVKSITIDENVTVHLLPGYERHENTLIHTITQLQKSYPAPGKVVAFFPAMYDDYRDSAQAVTTDYNPVTNEFGTGDRVVVIDTSTFEAATSLSSWHVPAYLTVSEGVYVITHEWGHVFDNRTEDFESFTKRLSASNLLISTYGSDNLRPKMEFFGSLSEYGQSNEKESYAECFTEWVITNGKTDNFAAKWYAKEYGWPTHDKPAVTILSHPRKPNPKDAVSFLNPYYDDSYNPFGDDKEDPPYRIFDDNDDYNDNYYDSSY